MIARVILVKTEERVMMELTATLVRVLMDIAEILVKVKYVEQ